MLNSCCFNPPVRCLPCRVCSVLQTHSKMTFDSSHRKPCFSKITIIILPILTSACLWGAIGCGNEHQKTLAPKCKAARCSQRSCSSSHRFAREETSLTQSRDCRKLVGKGRTWNKFAGTAVCVWKCVNRRNGRSTSRKSKCSQIMWVCALSMLLMHIKGLSRPCARMRKSGTMGVWFVHAGRPGVLPKEV